MILGGDEPQVLTQSARVAIIIAVWFVGAGLLWLLRRHNEVTAFSSVFVLLVLACIIYHLC
jgi:hypothetical protein